MTVTKPDLRTSLTALVGCALVVVALLAVALLVDGDGRAESETAASIDGFTAPYADRVETRSGIVHDVDLRAGTSTQDFGGGPVEVWAYNGTVPGPALRIRLGDTVRVTLHNELDVATAVHWHGIRVPNDMDGVPGVNQQPIEPGTSFTYEFTPPDAGTYWYHSHLRGNEQVERGLYGSLVVEEPDEPTYDQDLVWMVDDWLFDDTGQIDSVFDSSDDVHHNGRWGDTFTVNGVREPAIAASPGERLRIRLVNASTARIYQLRVGELDARIIAVDGLGVQEPIPAEDFLLAPGNRVDLDIVVPGDATSRFTIADRFTGIEPIPLGHIDVTGEAHVPNDFAAPTAEVPDWTAAAGVEPSVVFDLALVGEEVSEATGLAGDPQGTFRWTVNGRSWPDATVHVAELGRPEIVRFSNRSGAFHPMHLHGQFFQVVARNGAAVREGHFRDTVLLGAQEVVDIVVVPTDVGTWALHCHIQLHAEYGMMALYEVQP